MLEIAKLRYQLMWPKTRSRTTCAPRVSFCRPIKTLNSPMPNAVPAAGSEMLTVV